MTRDEIIFLAAAAGNRKTEGQDAIDGCICREVNEKEGLEKEETEKEETEKDKKNTDNEKYPDDEDRIKESPPPPPPPPHHHLFHAENLKNCEEISYTPFDPVSKKVR